MRRPTILAVLGLSAALVLTGCGGPDNKDPRHGRVVTRQSNCLWGDCAYDWKVCIGPDLFVHYDGMSDHRVRNAPECKP
jgi:hypothetical protein